LLVATGAVGFTPPDPRRSFYPALERAPHAIVADAGSADIGPLFLGSDAPYNDPEWERLDLARLLDGVDRLGVPLIVGSCGGAGTDRGVEAYAQLVSELARERGRSYDVALILAEQPREWAHTQLHRGGGAQPTTPLLDADAAAIAAEIDASDRLVAVMGAAPIRDALGRGAQVVLAGRACDDALFAAAAMWRGARPAPAYLAGKLLENASLVAEPFVLRESVIAEIDADTLVLEPMLPEQRCTRVSIAAELMYERRTPYEQYGPDGVLDLSELVIEEVDERRVRLHGAQYRDGAAVLKVEGAGSAGFRSLCIVGCRDPRMIAALGGILHDLEERVSSTGAEVATSVFGRDAVMGSLEPVRTPPHEVGIVVETLAPTQELANRACLLAKRLLFSAKFPGQKQTGGSVLSMIDEFLECGRSYRWTVNHLFEVEDTAAPFRIEMRRLGER
jgi:hypothetical protein